MEEKINKLHQMIKEIFPETVFVKIEVDIYGIRVDPTYRTNTKNCSMLNICGQWIKRES